MKTAFRLVAALALALCSSAVAQAPQIQRGPVQSVAPTQRTPRVALVIANGDYLGEDNGGLPDLANTGRDGRLVSDALRNVGFDVEMVENLSRQDTLTQLTRFSQRARDADVAIIYFAGLGFEVGGINYLAPVDLQSSGFRGNAAPTEAVLKAAMLDVPTFVDAVRQARSFGMVMADAGRGDPWARSSRGISLSETARTSDVIILYSSAAGEEARDGGPGDANGPFAAAVARHIREPGLELGLFARRVRADVMRATAGDQSPTVYGELSDRELYFIPPVAVAAPAQPAVPTLVLSNQPRLALVIGNGDYNADRDYGDDRLSDAVKVEGFAPDLPNAPNDATDIAASLTRLGFQVDPVINADRSTLSRALFAFEEKVKNAGPDAIVLIYYAGHAIQVSGANFLVPVGAKMPRLDFTRMSDAETEFELTQYAVPINILYDRLKNPSSTGLNLIILDACRENPWESRGLGRSVTGSGGGATRGLADIRVPLRRTAIAFATKPGDTADDSAGGRNSPYTAALKEWLQRPGVNVRDMFDGVASQVERVTNNHQSPWLNSPALGSTCLGPCPATP